LEIAINKSKTRHPRETMHEAATQPKQTTLDDPRYTPQKEPTKETDSDCKKQIAITKIDTATKEEELSFKIQFRLFPSRTYFSKITAELYFDGQQLKRSYISIPQGPLAADEFEFTSVLDMKGISSGPHKIKAEMYELWASTEKLNFTSKEITVEYVPVSREDRLIKIPIVKSIAGADLAIISDSDKDLYREIEESKKKELTSKRDEW
jgi:hypothetical protein